MADERKRRAEMYAYGSSTTDKWLWIRDAEQAYAPARVVKENADGSAEVEVGLTAAPKLAKKSEVYAPILRVSDLKESFEDMVRMSDVNEATILHNLR